MPSRLRSAPHRAARPVFAGGVITGQPPTSLNSKALDVPMLGTAWLLSGITFTGSIQVVEGAAPANSWAHIAFEIDLGGEVIDSVVMHWESDPDQPVTSYPGNSQTALRQYQAPYIIYDASPLRFRNFYYGVNPATYTLRNMNLRWRGNVDYL